MLETKSRDLASTPGEGKDLDAVNAFEADAAQVVLDSRQICRGMARYLSLGDSTFIQFTELRGASALVCTEYENWESTKPEEPISSIILCLEP